MADGSLLFETNVDPSGISAGMVAIGNLVASGVQKSVSALGDLSKAVVTLGMDFQAKMSEVGAIAGASAGDFTLLTEKAKEMGAATKFSATESAEAFLFMAQAGWSTQQMLEGINGVMMLAAASGEDLALTSSIVTDTMTAFGMSADQAGHFADVLTQAANATNTGVAELGESFKYCAPVAGALGYSVEDVSVALGLMANQGLKGSAAGTALRTIFTNLVKPTSSMAEAMDDLGISITDSSGEMKPLNQLLVEMRAAFSNLTPAQKAQYAATLAGKEGMSGFLAVINASEQDFNNVTAAMNNATGAAEEMSKIMSNNLAGDMDELSSAVEGLGLQIYESFNDSLRVGVQAITDAFNSLTAQFQNGELQESLAIIAEGFGNLVTAGAELLENTLPLIVKGFAAIVEHGDLLIPVLAGLAAGFVALKTITAVTSSLEAASKAMNAWQHAQVGATAAQAAVKTGITAYQALVGSLQQGLGLATAAQNAFTAALAANPYMVAAVAIGALATATGLAIKAFRDSVSEATEHTEAWRKTKDQIEQTSTSIKQSAQDFKDGWGSIGEEQSKIKDLVAELEGLTSASSITADGQKRLEEIVSELNARVPELNLAYDAQTNSLNMTNEQLQKYLTNQENVLRAELARERAKKLIEEQNALETERQIIKDKLLETESKFNKELYEGTKIASQYGAVLSSEAVSNMEYKQTIDDQTAALEAKDAQLAANDKQLKEALSTEAEYQEKIRETSDILNDQTDSWYEYLSAMIEASVVTGEVSDEMKSRFGEISDSATDAFSKIKEGSAQSFEEIMENLKFNEEATKNYGDNLAKMVEEGFSQAAIAALDKGPESAAQIAAALGWSDEQTQEFNQQYADSGSAAVDAVAQSILAHSPEARQAASDMAAVVVAALEDMEPNVRTEAEKALEAMGVAFNDGKPELKGTAEDILDTVGSALGEMPENTRKIADESMQKIVDRIEARGGDVSGAAHEITSGYINEIGIMPVESTKAADESIDGIVGGLESGKPNVESAAQGVTNAAGNGLSGAYSKGESGGINFSEGFAAGIIKKSGLASMAAVNLTNDAMTAANRAMNAHSPSKRTEEMGGWFSGGFAGGITKNADKAAEAAEKMTQSAMDAIAETQDSHSDSKVTAGFGKDADYGYGNSIRDNADKPVREMEFVVNATLEVLDDAESDFEESGEHAMEIISEGIGNNDHLPAEATEVAVDKIQDTAKDAEPELEEIGRDWIAELAEGAEASADMLASAVDVAAKSGFEAAEKWIEEYTERQAEAAKERLEIQKDELKEREKAEKEAVKKSKSLSKDQKEAEIKIIEQKYKEETKLLDKKIKEVGKAEELSAATRIKLYNEIATSAEASTETRNKAEVKVFELTKKLIDEKRKSLDMAAWEEAELYLTLARKYQDNEKIKIQANEASMSAIKEALKERKETEAITAEELKVIWQEYTAQFGEGTKERVAAENEALEESRRMIQERVDAEEASTGTILGLYAKQKEEFQGTVQAKKEADADYNEAKKELIAEINELEQEYYDALHKRIEEVANFASLFEEVVRESVDKTELIFNMESQLAALQQWTRDMQVLTERGLDEGVLEELRKMGPSAVNEVQALASMTDPELQRYSEIYRQKQELATQYVTKEMEGMRQEVTDKITLLLADIEQSASGVTELGETIGTELTNAIARKILDGSMDVNSAVETVINNAFETGKAAAGIASPAKKFMPIGENIDAGIAVGMKHENYTADATSDLMHMAFAAANSQQDQLATVFGGGYSEITNNNQSTGASFVIEKIIVEGAPINSNLDAKRVARDIGEEISRRERQLGVFSAS